MNMIAIVVRVYRWSLLVRNEEDQKEVIVLFSNVNSLSVNDRIKINFNGQMTLSIPPRITATSIHRLDNVSQSHTNEMRAVVLRRNRDSLVVRNSQKRQEIHVEYPYAYHFCIGQRIIVKYNSIMLDDTNHITAMDVHPVC